MKMIRVKLTDIEYATLESVMRQGEYQSLSEAIRDALRGLWDRSGVSAEVRQQMALERLRHAPRRRRRTPADIDVWVEDGREAFAAEQGNAPQATPEARQGLANPAEGASGEQSAGGSHTN
ncbi:MAG TPA: ribbon-helix-helix domain-containing protein [Hyphomicrobiaceae bacterium]|nr:ribbon-helix-helix domain-containing protein [Hyphomicrobiaceae bacterium]